MSLAECQVPTKAALSLPSSAGEGRKYNKRLVVEIRSRRGHSAITVMGKTDPAGGKNCFISHQSNQSRAMRENQILKTPSPHPSLLPWLKFTHVFPTSSPEQHRWMQNGGCGQLLIYCLCTPSSSGAGSLTSFLCSSMGSLPWEMSSMNFSSVSASHGLQFLMKGSSLALSQGVQSFRTRLLTVWVPHSVTSPASKPAPVQAPLSMRSCQEPLPLWSSHGVTASLGHPAALAWDPPWAAGGSVHPLEPPWAAGGSLLWCLEHPLPLFLR